MPAVIAIVGRPNVGKSTLFNRLVGRREAIVHDRPGVTRDRHYGRAELHGRPVVLIDTGGFEPESEDSLKAKMRAQAEVAVDEADIVLLLFDGRQGLTPEDEEVARQLRRSGKKLLHVVNKIDGDGQEADVAEFYRLGVDELFAVSAEHSRGVGDLIDKLVTLLPDLPACEAEAREGEGSEPDADAGAGDGPELGGAAAADAEQSGAAPVRVAVVGFPNVGKSTLVNHLLGEERTIAHDRPGTTRDSLDLELVRGVRRYVLVDTAGVRRKSRAAEVAEKISAIKALKVMDRADVALLLLDATRGVADQEARIADYAAERGCGLVIVVNKIDLIKGDSERGRELARQVQYQLRFVDFAPVRRLSAETGRGVHKLLDSVDRVAEQRRHRVPTSELNRFFERVVEHHDPPRYRGRDVKFNYIAQIAVGPPTFALVCNQPEGVPAQYRRYVTNALREAYGFEGSPIRLRIRKKKRRQSRW